MRVAAGLIAVAFCSTAFAAWRPPYLDDGTGHPSKYHVWRRVQGSLAPFAKIGTTTNPTYVDTLSGSGAFEYEVTAVMN